MSFWEVGHRSPFLQVVLTGRPLLLLQVGSTVEVKNPEGGLSEGVISKLTDASWYTVGKPPSG